jgi:hypothetical protein
MTDAGISIVWAGVAAVTITASAAIVSIWISRQIKISEFRQAWVNDLRSDIADYTGIAYKWFHKYYELDLENLPPDEMVIRQRQELVPIVNDANVLLRKIKLRFNPRDNQNKQQDDEFLENLSSLVNATKLDSPQLAASWDHLAETCVSQAREILKREWEVTKHPVRHWFIRRWSRSQPYLMSAREHIKSKSESIRSRFGSS